MDTRVEAYIAWYKGEYKHKPSMIMIEKYYKMYGIDEKVTEELPQPDESFWRDGPLDG